MGLFSPNRGRRAAMANYEPLAVANRDEAVGRIADVFWNEPIQARNDFANRLLAWAEREDAHTYDSMKRLVVDTECAVTVEAWTREDPTVDAADALADLRRLVLDMVRAVASSAATPSNYHTHLGPDIPLIIGEVFARLRPEDRQ